MKKKKAKKLAKKLEKAKHLNSFRIDPGFDLPPGVYSARLDRGWIENTETGEMYVLEWGLIQ